MSKKHKYLFRISELSDRFASLGRKLKKNKRTGIDNQVLKGQYKEAQEFQKGVNVARRHVKWKKVYEPVWGKEKKRALDQLHKTDHLASKYARQKAEQAVVDEFPDEVTTTRAVRDVMNGISNCNHPKYYTPE